MDTLRICQQCQSPLPADAPEGLCPKCLLARGLEATVASEIVERGDVSPLAPPGDESPGTARELAPSQSGDKSPHSKIHYFGDYELLEEIARGGMGVVWKARQTSLNRIVAVKMILAGKFASADDVQRFHTEAEAAANLQHPNIVAIHEVGEHEGQHYFSMDYVEGKNLAEVVRDGPLPAAKAAALVKTIAEAIHYAHQRGTLHRDLKPSNVLLDAAGQPRITDFGLAKLTQRDSSLTQTGAVMGTPAYMPPEQAAGRRAEFGPASDVYSLGAMLYELLTGKAPFIGETPMATLMKVLEEEPLSPKKHNPLVPPDLETICLKCLEKKPERRYASAREVSEELGRFLNAEPILARPASFPRKAWNWSVRHPWVLTGLASFVALGLFTAVYGLWQQNRYLIWLQAHPGHVRIPGSLSSELGRFNRSYFLLGVMALLLMFSFYAPDTIKRRRRRVQPHFHLILWLCGGWGATAVLASFYVALKHLEAHVWENHLLNIKTVSPSLWLFCAISGLVVSLIKRSIFTAKPDSFRANPGTLFSQWRNWTLRSIPSRVTSFLYLISFTACLWSGFGALSETVGVFYVPILFTWWGTELVRRAMREHQAASDVSVDSVGLIPEEVQMIENFLFVHNKRQAALWFQFYSSERGAKEIKNTHNKSAKASPEARAFIEKLALELQRKHPEKFLRTPEEWRKDLADLEKKIGALEANQLEQFPDIKSEEQRQQYLAICKAGLPPLRSFVAMSAEEPPNEPPKESSTLKNWLFVVACCPVVILAIILSFHHEFPWRGRVLVALGVLVGSVLGLFLEYSVRMEKALTDWRCHWLKPGRIAVLLSAFGVAALVIGYPAPDTFGLMFFTGVFSCGLSKHAAEIHRKRAAMNAVSKSSNGGA